MARTKAMATKRMQRKKKRCAKRSKFHVKSHCRGRRKRK